MQTKPWSSKFDTCQQCGQTDSPHEARGFCSRCYFQNYARDNAEAIKRDKRRWYKSAGGREWSRLQREQRQYDGQREAVLQRDQYKCQKCGSTRQLCVHHKDGKGRSVPIGSKNNLLDNLTTLCRRCHLEAHRQQLYNARAKTGFFRPSGLRYKNSRRN